MRRAALTLCLLIAALSLAACAARGEPGGAYSGTLVLEGQHAYPSGTTLRGVLVVVDGEVTLEAGSQVQGPVYLLGGLLNIDGQVEGDVSVIGGRLALQPQAVIAGDLRLGGGELSRAEQAAVHGRVLTGAASGVQPAELFPERSLNSKLAWLLPEALLLSILAYLAARYLPRPLERVSQAAIRHPLVCVAMGLLGGVVGLVLLVVMAFTLILIPVTVLGLVAGFLAIGYGWAAIGLALGRRLARERNWDLPVERAAFLGTLLFMLAANLASLLPILDTVIGGATLTISIGAMLLTRFGLREFVPEMDWPGES